MRKFLLHLLMFAFLRGLDANAQSRETFVATASMNTERSFHTATLLKDGQVLITGGYTNPNPNPAGPRGCLKSAELYDPSTARFVATQDMSWFRVGHTATLIRDGRVLIAGGWDGVGNLATAELFVPVSIQGQVPTLSLDKTQYCAGDSWRLQIVLKIVSCPK
jgi:galactose oxidase-like protein